MIISIIVAVSENNVIGKENKLPWHLPADLKYFKKLTTGHHIIMGRSTYDSLGKPLPNRINIVVTRQQDFDAPGCVVVSDLKSAFEYAGQNQEEECFVIGGGDIIRQSIVWADKLYITRIHHSFEGDTFLPEINLDDWKMIEEIKHKAEGPNSFPYSFQILELQASEHR